MTKKTSSTDFKDNQFDSAATSYPQEIPMIKVPEDTHNIGYLLMVLFGIGALLPWNAILTALDFFTEKMPDYDPSFIFGFAVNSLLTVIQVLILLYGHKVSYVMRISGGFIAIAVLMIVLPLVTNYLEEDPAFAVSITILVIFGGLGGIVQGSVFGMAGMFPFKYMGAVMFGNGLSGISVNLLRAICLGIFPPVKGSDNNFKGSLVYFILAAIILILAAVGMVVFMRLPFAQYYIRKATNEKFKTQRRISGIKEDMDDGSKVLLDNDINKSNNDSNILSSGGHSRNVSTNQQQQPVISPFMAFLIMMKRSFLISWQFLLSISCVFAVTFIVFPGVSLHTSLKFLEGIEDENVRGAWFALILIIIFNIFDTVGRWLAGQKFGQASDRLVLILTYARVIFIATFVLIAKDVSPSWLFGEDSDWFKIVNMILFSFTNGYCSTQCAIKAPSRAPDDSKEQVGTFIGLFLTLGILIGSIIAIGMGHIF